MYLEHFGLREPPFSLTPDTAYFFEYGHYCEALNTLLVALRSGEGFIKVTGEVGTGKTLLCRKLLALLDEEFYTAYIPNPFLTPSALNLAVVEELGLELPRNAGQHRIVKELNARLVGLTAEGRRVVLCIDEAQAMPAETLEILRLLTNLETEKRKLLHVVLFGQPELDAKLARPAARQLRQRITFSYRLEPIDLEGMTAYVAHRLVVAGSQGRVQFTRGALRRLHRASRGIPRLVNILAHKSLMACYGRGGHTIEAAHVRLAAADTEDMQPPAHLPWMAAGLAAGVVLVLALGYWRGLFAGVLE